VPCKIRHHSFKNASAFFIVNKKDRLSNSFLNKKPLRLLAICNSKPQTIMHTKHCDMLFGLRSCAGENTQLCFSTLKTYHTSVGDACWGNDAAI
jgi:hypothetical protein